MFRKLVLLALSLSAAFAQSDRGTLTGTVTDAQGAVIAGAELSLKHQQTGAA